MGSIALDRLHQVGNQVVAPGQLYVNLGESVLDAVAFVNETVVNTDAPEHNRCEYCQEYKE